MVQNIQCLHQDPCGRKETYYPVLTLHRSNRKQVEEKNESDTPGTQVMVEVPLPARFKAFPRQDGMLFIPELGSESIFAKSELHWIKIDFKRGTIVSDVS